VPGAQLGADRNKGTIQLLDAQPIQMLTQATVQFHAAEQPAAAKCNVEKIEHAPPGKAAGELFQLVQLSGQITAANKRADRRAGNHLDIDIGFVQRAQHADMGPAACSATAQRQGYPARVSLDFGLFSGFFCWQSKVVIRSLPLLPPCKHHDGSLFVSTPKHFRQKSPVKGQTVCVRKCTGK